MKEGWLIRSYKGEDILKFSYWLGQRPQNAISYISITQLDGIFLFVESKLPHEYLHVTNSTSLL